MPEPPKLLLRSEAAERLRCSTDTVKRLGRAGLLEERRFGRLVRVTAASVEALERGEDGPADD
jgi:excisionase family DNA binding protein